MFTLRVGMSYFLCSQRGGRWRETHSTQGAVLQHSLLSHRASHGDLAGWGGEPCTPRLQESAPGPPLDASSSGWWGWQLALLQRLCQAGKGGRVRAVQSKRQREEPSKNWRGAHTCQEERWRGGQQAGPSRPLLQHSGGVKQAAPSLQKGVLGNNTLHLVRGI